MSSIQKYEKAELLSLENPLVVKAALMLGRKPDNLIRQISEIFPSRAEQAIALNVMAEFSHQPFTIKKVLTVMNGGNDYLEQDLIPSSATGVSVIEQMLPVLEGTLSLILRVPNDYSGLRLGCKRAAKLVIIYGSYVDDFLSSIVDDAEFLATILHMHRSSEANIIRRALAVWELGIIPYCESNGLPFPLTLREFFEDYGDQFDVDELEEHDSPDEYPRGIDLIRYTEAVKSAEQGD